MQLENLIQTRNIRTALGFGSCTSVPVLKMHFFKTNISLKIKKIIIIRSHHNAWTSTPPHLFLNSAKRVATTKRLEKAFIQHKQDQYSTNSTSGRCSKQAEIQSYMFKKPRSLSCWKGKIAPWVPLWAGDVLTPNSLAVALVLSIYR